MQKYLNQTLRAAPTSEQLYSSKPQANANLISKTFRKRNSETPVVQPSADHNTQTLPQYHATRDLEELTPIGAKFSQLSGKRAIEMRTNVATDFTSKGYEKDKGPGYQTKTPIH